MARIRMESKEQKTFIIFGREAAEHATRKRRGSRGSAALLHQKLKTVAIFTAAISQATNIYLVYILTRNCTAEKSVSGKHLRQITF